MGYSGTPMITVNNNRNLLTKRESIFKSDGPRIYARRKEIFNEEKFTPISDYENDQKKKRRNKILLALKRKRTFENYLAVLLVISFIFIIWNNL